MSDPVGDPLDDDEEVELPERIIVVREPIDADPDEAAAELEALAAAAVAEATEEDVADEALVEIDATLGVMTPEDGPARAETGEASSEDAEELPGWPAATDEASREPAIDLDEVDLRFEEPVAPEATDVEVDLTTGAGIDEVPADVEVQADDDDELFLDALAQDLADTHPLADADPLAVHHAVADTDPLADADPVADADEVDEEPATVAAPVIPAVSDPRATSRTQPRRDETGPGTLRPKVPEPVIAARSTSAVPSRSRRLMRRVRALLGLVFVVVLSGVGLAAVIGSAILLVVLALSRAFGSGG